MSHKTDSSTSLDGKTILVTGASSGLGAHIATVLAGDGATILAAARRIDRLQGLSEVTDGKLFPIEMDVSDSVSVENGMKAALGITPRLDGLVNNAGIAWTGPALDMEPDAWDRVIDTNLNGAFYVARAAARAMAETGGGAILSTASILGFGTGPRVAAYAASKAAVVHMTRCLALEWARHNIRVNAIAPGYFPTEMNSEYLESEMGDQLRKGIPMRRFGQYSDLDGPVRLLLSDAGSYITGVTLPVDGGHLCRAL
ncbi:MAG: SDR family oxidoreductase [Pseudomonadota bacterium]